MAGACGQAVCARVCVCACVRVCMCACVRERSFFVSSTSTRSSSSAAGRCSPPTLFFFSRKFRQLEREVGHHEKRWRTLFSIVRMHSRYAPAVVQVCVWCAHICVSFSFFSVVLADVAFAVCVHALGIKIQHRVVGVCIMLCSMMRGCGGGFFFFFPFPFAAFALASSNSLSVPKSHHSVAVPSPLAPYSGQALRRSWLLRLSAAGQGASGAGAVLCGEWRSCGPLEGKIT